jgi:hypothetical protein
MENANVSTSTAAPADAGSTQETESQEQAPGARGQGSETDIRAPNAKDQAQSSTQQQMKELSDEYMDHLVKVKVDGKEQKVPLKEAIRLTQLEKASQARMQEAAKVRQEMKQREAREQQLAHLMETDFAKFCQVVGKDPRQIAVDFLAKQYDLEQMHPAERKAMELEQKLKDKEESEKQREEDQKTQKQQQLEKHFSQAYDRELGEALQASSLPKNKLFVQRVAHKMLESIERVKANIDESPLQARDAVAKVKEDWLSDVKDTLGTLDAKAIHELLGEEVLAKIRQFDIARVTGQQQRPTEIESESRPANQAASGKQAEPMNEFERRKYMADLKRKLP